ncbi:MAG: AraC family transcriptional regulator, partial [Clostridiales bacterium]|nr:AraC family transcriptional regulator [Clostridiales bacterium]
MQIPCEFQFTKPEIITKIEGFMKDNYSKGFTGQDDALQRATGDEFIKEYLSYYVSRNPDCKSQSNGSKPDSTANIKSHLSDMLSSRPDKTLIENDGIAVTIHPNYSLAEVHDHTFFEIICVISGKCVNVSAGHTLELNAGDIVILAPGIMHSISANDDDCFILNIIINPKVFEKTFLPSFTERDIMYVFFSNVMFQYSKDAFILFHAQNDALITSILWQLNSLSGHNHLYEEQVKVSSLNLLFARLLAYHVNDAVIFNEVFSGMHQDLALLLHYLQGNFTKVTLADTSAFFGYSERQIQRILQKYTGKSFKEIINYLRAGHAARMLVETTKSIDEISAICG